jgi:hypothetical protein
MVGNISPYSSGAPGASLTSTSVDPQTQSSQLLWDEVRKNPAVASILVDGSPGRTDVRRNVKPTQG